jgi:glycosyltransferase involved in cell wall biosynthesis
VPRYDVTVVLNYYAPYVSGLTEAARLVAEGLAARGHRVAVVCSQHDPRLPRREHRAGVDVVRCPVVYRISRGVLSPAFPVVAGALARQSKVVHLHAPMLEAGLIARLAGGTPVLTTYHLDLWLPNGPVNAAAAKCTDISARLAIRRSDAVVVNSADQANHSRIRGTLDRRGYLAIPAPCVDRGGGKPALRETDGLHIGFMGRIVAEKGIEYLVEAFRRIPEADARLLLAGDYLAVAGGSVIDRVRAAADGDGRIRILGLLSGADIDDFYSSIDLFALPSVYESFGIVQAEAMIVGVPSITAEVPGGRVPVQQTGFGVLVPPGDPDAIVAAIGQLRVLPQERRAERAALARQLYGVTACVDAYEKIIWDLY